MHEFSKELLKESYSSISTNLRVTLSCLYAYGYMDQRVLRHSSQDQTTWDLPLLECAFGMACKVFSSRAQVMRVGMRFAASSMCIRNGHYENSRKSPKFCEWRHHRIHRIQSIHIRDLIRVWNPCIYIVIGSKHEQRSTL